VTVAVRSTTTVSPGTRSNTPFTAPTGLSDNDYLLLIMASGAAIGITVTPPSGFSALAGWPLQMTKADPWTTNCYAWGKLANGESGGSYTTSHGSAGTDGILYCISGGDVTSPLSPTPTTNSGNPAGVDANIICTGLTTLVDGCLIIAVGYGWDGQASTPPTGTTPTFTERFDPGSTGTCYAADGIMTTAGSTGNKTIVAGSNQYKWTSGLISIQPSASGGGGGSTAEEGIRQNNNQTITPRVIGGLVRGSDIPNRARDKRELLLGLRGEYFVNFVGSSSRLPKHGELVREANWMDEAKRLERQICSR
jgi:hypothetical protein